MKGGGYKAYSVIILCGNLFYGKIFQEVKNVSKNIL